MQHAQFFILGEEHDVDMTNIVDLLINGSGTSCSRRDVRTGFWVPGQAGPQHMQLRQGDGCPRRSPVILTIRIREEHLGRTENRRAQAQARLPHLRLGGCAGWE